MTTVEVGYDGNSQPPSFLPGFGSVEVGRHLINDRTDALTGVRVSTAGIETNYEIIGAPRSLLEDHIGQLVVRQLDGSRQELQEVAVSIRTNGFKLDEMALATIALDALAQSATIETEEQSL